MLKKLVSGPILAQIWAQKPFSWILSLLDVRNYCKQSMYAISKKANEPNLRKQQKTQFWAQLSQIWAAKFFLKNLAPSVTRCYGQLSSCTISEKTNDSILRKLSDGRTDGRTDERTDGQTDESDFIGRCPTNVERPTIETLEKIMICQ